MKPYYTLLTIVALLALVGCATTPKTPEPTTAPVPAPGFEDVEEMVVEEAGGGEEQVEEIVIEPRESIRDINIIAKRWNFEPNRITVKKGERIVLHVKSMDVTHGFSIPDFGINEQLKPGEITNIEFVADKKGSFSFRCTVFCGSGHGGMSGTLIVE